MEKSLMPQKTPSENSIIIPFLKWAGGKRWLVSSYPELFPQNYNSYLEPFLGSGAVYFHLCPEKAVLGDSNADLINTYTEIRDNWEAVQETLKRHHQSHSKEFYYEIRSKRFKSPTQRAAQFIYLNRTCWNGLYRVNLNGNFNVPIGTKKNVLLESDNFAAVSLQLQGANLQVLDFEEIVNSSKRGDFLFIDPPYTVKHNLNGFVKYNDQLFSWDDQIRLRNSVERAVSRGVQVLLTNADHTSIHELYNGIGEIIRLSRLSVISGNPKARGRYSEVIIKSYKK